MKKSLLIVVLLLPIILFSQHNIIIDGRFEDWDAVTTVVTDSAHDEHDTDWYGDGLSQPVPRKYSDIDIVEAKFTHDKENLYAYVRASGIIGRTSRSADGQKAGRYYYIITIDVDNNDSTGYALQEGNYWPNSTGYDVNMEVEFYDGSFNTGHYINHDFLNDAELAQGSSHLYNHILRLGPGTYDYYTQWVVFPDSTIIEVSDRGPVYQGIIEVAVSGDGHEAEMKAPMWGWFADENGVPTIQLGDTLDISFSLEASGELSESAIEAGYNGNKSVWGSDTADPIEGYVLQDLWSGVDHKVASLPKSFQLKQNYPNPFNPQTTISYSLYEKMSVRLFVVNSNGRVVRNLMNNLQQAGDYSLQWDGRDDYGNAMTSGIYFAVLKSAENRQVRRMVLLR